MKHSILFAALAASLLSLASCGGSQPDPLTEAVKAKIAESVKGSPADVRLDHFELIDSSALGTERSRCKDLFRVKIKRENELYEKYQRNGQYNTASAKVQVIAKAQKNYDGIEALEKQFEAQKDSIIAYHYKLAGRAKNAEGAVAKFDEAYVAVTPDNQVLTLVTDKRDLSKVVRHAIPGYMELLGSDKEE